MLNEIQALNYLQETENCKTCPADFCKRIKQIFSYENENYNN